MAGTPTTALAKPVPPRQGLACAASGRGPSTRPCALIVITITLSELLLPTLETMMTLTEGKYRLISADDHVDLSHEQIKANLATRFHQDYDGAVGEFVEQMMP